MTRRYSSVVLPIARSSTPRILSAADCSALAQRVIQYARGGGTTRMFIDSSWTGNARWARNAISTSGDVRDVSMNIGRTVRGAQATVSTNVLEDAPLEAAVRRAERLLIQEFEDLEASLVVPFTEPYVAPSLWFERTNQLDERARADVVRAALQSADAAGMHSAGYLEVTATGRAALNTDGRSLYYPFTNAQLSMTVRDPKGMGSGWAGVDWNDWSRIDVTTLTATALEKCLASRNPVALEPGRYTAILEPQAVCDLVAPLFNDVAMDRDLAEREPGYAPFAGKRKGESKIGEPVIDVRLTIRADPMDPECGFPPLDASSRDSSDIVVYHSATWIDQGVLQALAYDRGYGIEELGVNLGLPNSGAFHMSGGTTSIAEMIASTQRGVLVTRFWGVEVVDFTSMLLTGYTRDGVWLIEQGKISKAVKNFRFTESPLIALNHVEQLGPPQRVFRPERPAVVPSLKVRDFSFTSLTDAV